MAGMQGIIEKQKNSFDSAGASRQIMDQQLANDLCWANDRLLKERQSNDEQTQYAKELQNKIERMDKGHDDEIEKTEEEHKKMLSKMETNHRDEVNALKEQLELWQSVMA